VCDGTLPPGRSVGQRPGQAECRAPIDDDVRDNRELLVQILGPAGFEARLASDGEPAARVSGRQRPHLILMESLMP
jgi:CheY-like chemotaxis protein